MKVRKLIELLQSVDQDAVVCTYLSEVEEGGRVTGVLSQEECDDLYFKGDSPHESYALSNYVYIDSLL